MDSNWQPIETAPKNGTVILSTWRTPFFTRKEWTIQPVKFLSDVWLHGWDENEVKPTHWMPLPQPPNEE